MRKMTPEIIISGRMTKKNFFFQLKPWCTNFFDSSPTFSDFFPHKKSKIYLTFFYLFSTIHYLLKRKKKLKKGRRNAGEKSEKNRKKGVESRRNFHNRRAFFVLIKIPLFEDNLMKDR